MKVHFIDKTEDSCVMFLCESLRFYNVSRNVKEVVEDILKNVPKDEIIKKYVINQDTYETINHLILSEPAEDITGESEDSLYRLVLNVTNVCNLNCRYCYADGGSYSSAECMMDEATARKAVDLFYKKYRRIKVIQFFGGEPLLNETVIRFVCQYITELYESGVIDQMPLFGTVSNGTVYSDQLAETINKYHISVTFSIDGPQEIHDKMRIDKCGNGSFQKIEDNIAKYNHYSAELNAAEVTYNASHEECGYSVLDTVKFLKNDMNIQNVHIVPVSGDACENFRLHDRESFSESVEEIFNEMKNNKKDYSYAFVNRIVKALKMRKANKYLCEAGISNYSVSCKGDVYPCFMFTDVEKFKMGNIFDQEPFFDSPHFLQMKNTLKSFSKYNYSKCENCFNNRICSGCLGTNYFNCNDINCTPDEDCEMQKKLTEKVLIGLSELA